MKHTYIKNRKIDFSSVVFIIIAGILFGSFFNLTAQNKGFLQVTATVLEHDFPLEETIITIYRDGEKIDQVRTPISGGFAVDFNFDKEYLIEIYKEGMVNKKFAFYTALPKKEDHTIIYSFEFIVSLFPEFEDPNMKIFEEPLGLIRFDKPSKEYKHDIEYSEEIMEVVSLLETKARNMQTKYYSALDKADILFQEEKYKEAIVEYARASKIFEQKHYPVDQIKEAKRLYDIIKKLSDKYNLAIDRADIQFKAGRYDAAIAEYEVARSIIPSKKYPKEKIAEINKIIGGKEDLEQQYARHISNGDKDFSDKNYAKSKSSYEFALSVKPNEAYPKTQISKINTIAAAEKKNRDTYNRIITIADGLFNDQNYTKSKEAYQKALSYISSEKYPSSRISEIDRLLGGLQNLANDYKGAITQGDKLFATKNYDKSKDSYEKALQYKPNEQYPKLQIAKITKILTIIANKENAQEQYQAYISEADKLYNSESYTESKSTYLKAIKLKPTDQYPRTQIAKIDQLLGGIAKNDADYKKYVTLANNLNKEKDYSRAKIVYKKALEIKPKEEYPQQKIDEINAIMSTEKDDGYNKVIAIADKYFNEKNYPSAISSYKKALTILPSKKYPKDKMEEIKNIINSQKDKETQYKTLIVSADNQLRSKELEKARNSYEKALAIKPNEAYPKQQISKIDKLIGLIANRSEKQKEYADLVAQADKKFNTTIYSEAKTLYQKANKLMPSEQYPSTKIKEINILLAKQQGKKATYEKYISLADNLFKSKSYKKAIIAYNEALKISPKEKYPQNQIDASNNAIEKALSDLYNNAIAAADKLLLEKKYSNAVSKYNNALSYKPKEAYPQNQIDKIRKTLASNKDEIKKSYEKAIASADKYFGEKNYEESINSYNNALAIVPTAPYPKSQIEKINKLTKILAAKQNKKVAYDKLIAQGDSYLTAKSYKNAVASYQKSLKILPSEAYPKTKINEIKQIIARERLQAYNNMIAKADASFNSKNYQNAIASYTKASKLKPKEVYPKQKIAAINKYLEETQGKEVAYKQFISAADKQFNSNEYAKAKQNYQQASNIKPTESYPKTKIAAINKILGELAAKKKQYGIAIQEADKLFTAKEYPKAREKYLLASSISSEKKYPKDKVVEIDNIINSMQAEFYNKYIADAATLLNSKKYKESRDLYRKASRMRPNEKHPQDQIAKINKLLEGSEYQTIIAKADNLFDIKDFSSARESYRQARRINPSESYPKSKIDEINRILKDEQFANAIGDIRNEFIEKGKRRQYSFSSIARKTSNNYFLIKARNLSDKPFKIILNFGKDESNSGGLVLLIDNKEGATIYEANVGSQQAWLDIENNWLSLTPLGGDVEILQIEIKQGD